MEKVATILLVSMLVIIALGAYTSYVAFLSTKETQTKGICFVITNVLAVVLAIQFAVLKYLMSL